MTTSVLVAEGGGRWIEYAGGYSDMVAQRGAGIGAVRPNGQAMVSPVGGHGTGRTSRTITGGGQGTSWPFMLAETVACGCSGKNGGGESATRYVLDQATTGTGKSA